VNTASIAAKAVTAAKVADELLGRAASAYLDGVTTTGFVPINLEHWRFTTPYAGTTGYLVVTVTFSVRATVGSTCYVETKLSKTSGDAGVEPDGIGYALYRAHAEAGDLHWAPHSITASFPVNATTVDVYLNGRTGCSGAGWHYVTMTARYEPATMTVTTP
jgi:hypothetical protein